MRRAFLAALLLLASGSALGHADLIASEPAAGAVLEVGPGEVTLTYSERLESLFSVFKVYELDPAEVDLNADDAALRLNALAALLVNEVLELRDDGDEQVGFELVSEGATIDELALRFKEPLPAGHYVVMWRVLSVDTHVTQGFFMFSVIP